MMENGLSTEQANELLRQFGFNQLPYKKQFTALSLLFSQFTNMFTYMLLFAAGVSFFLGDQVDGFLILFILFLNTALGFWQEYKASKELEALRKLEVSFSRVIRDGKEQKLSSIYLVPGDVVLLESGDKIPADARVLESTDFSVNESSLTGESLPVVKSNKQDENIVYFGTTVVLGRAKIQLTETGGNTRFGKIAETLSDVQEEPTPLEVSLSNLTVKVGVAVIVITTLLFGLRIIQGFPFQEMFFTSIAIMVAAVPEGLPAVITIVLALGVQKMYRKKSLVRKMSAIESLGATTVICTDKTGTLTQNLMRVKEAAALKGLENELMLGSILCNSASVVMKEDHGGFDVLGDTTEGALLIWAKEKGLSVEEIRKSGKILEEIPFSLKTRMMTILWQGKDGKKLYTKGAPEAILAYCNLSKEKLEEETKKYKQMASSGLRVLALASKNVDQELGAEELMGQRDLEYLGLVGIADAVRPEAREALRITKAAGIKVVMITGDNELTADAIAREIGLISPGEEIVTGDKLSELSDEQLAARLDKIRIFARVQPEQKLRIIKAFQSKGEVVAVTGDGVNDALALKAAHVGVSMGITGTDVAKEASDIVILDDNFATIVSAVEQGRLIYSNIVKVVKFLLAGNLSEVTLITLAVILQLPTPLLPAQILWINFVTDGLPALALANDNASSNLMRVPPRSPSTSILSASNVKTILLGGGTIGVMSLLGFIYAHSSYGLDVARTVAFTTIIVFQMIYVFMLRKHHSIISNKFLLLSVGFVIIMQLMILTVPQLRTLFRV